MISDTSLYTLAILLGSGAMLLIVLYHFLEINAKDDGTVSKEKPVAITPQAQTKAKS
jgi:oligosaccharyl transferase complex subunit OST4